MRFYSDDRFLAEEVAAFLVRGLPRVRARSSTAPRALADDPRQPVAERVIPVTELAAVPHPGGRALLPCRSPRPERRCAGLPVVRADPLNLGQVFQSLVDLHALKYRSAAPLVITVSAAAEGDQWVSRCATTASASPTTIAYSRSSTAPTPAASVYGGVGIGLATCKRIVEQHGGRMWLESEPRHGTAVLFSLLSLPRSRG